MANWAVAIVQRELPRLGSDICNAWWFMAPRILGIASSAIFLIALALLCLYNVLSNVTMDSTASNSTNRCSTGVFGSESTLKINTSCTRALVFAAAATWETLFHFSDGELVFFLAQCFTWLAFTAICILENRQPRLVPFRGLARARWTIAFLLAAIKMTALVIQRFEKNCPNPCSTVALAAATVSLVASLVLVVTAVLKCPNGKESNQTQLNGDAETTEPLLEKQGAQEYFGYAGGQQVEQIDMAMDESALAKWLQCAARGRGRYCGVSFSCY